MQVLDVFIALASVLALSVFLALKARVPAGYAPLAALCGGSMWVAVCGMLGFLQAGAALWYALCFGLLVFALVFKRRQNNYKKLLAPAFLFFGVAALCMLAYFAIRQPLLYEWDEFTIWGPTVKQMQLTGRLYTTTQFGWWWLTSYVPALPALSFLVQFFGAFAEWKIYAAYNLLLLAAIASLFGWVSHRRYKLAVPLAVVGLLTPWFFTVYTAQIRVNTYAWLSAYGDLPAGMLFGGLLASYFGLRKLRAPLWPVGVMLATLSLVKDNVFVLALIAAGLIAVDMLLFGPRPAGRQPGPLARVKTRLGQGEAAGATDDKEYGAHGFGGWLWRGAAMLACAAAPFLIWSRYVADIVAQRAATGGTGATSEPLPVLFVKGIGMLLRPEERTEQFSLVLQKMWDEFFKPEAKIFMLGNGAVAVGLIAALFVLAIVLSHSGRLRLRAGLALLLSALGFLGYYLTLIISYGLVMKFEEGIKLASYNRYVYSYCIGWFLLAVCFLALAARGGRPYGFANGAILALALAMLLRTGMLLQPQYSAVGYPSYFYDEQRKEVALAEEILAKTGPGRRIYFVSQKDNGQLWFHYHTRLLPAILDYSGENTGDKAGGGGPVPFTRAQLQQYISQNGIEYMFIETRDDAFTQEFAPLFTDGLKAAKEGETVLYHVQGTGTSLRLAPVEMEVPAR